jgi:hypothetical protein
VGIKTGMGLAELKILQNACPPTDCVVFSLRATRDNV